VCERDGLVSGFPITKRYFGQGLVQGTTKLFYTFDHLGSVRELVDDAGTVQAQYRYTTYGERTKESGNLDSDWGYAGLWHHAPSGLDLATYRLYDAANKRWISRDPLGEGTDRTLYSYGWNNPISNIDPEGLDSAPPGMDPIEFRKGRNKKSKVKSVCAKETLEVTAMLGAAAITAAEWTLLGIDAAAYYQMTRGGGGSPAPVPAGRPNLGSFPRENNNIRTTTLPTSGHHANQLNPSSPTFRGWTQSSIDSVVNRPAATGRTTNLATGNPATAYFNQDGHYVVRDNVTGALVQTSHQNYPIGNGPGQWSVDSRIQMNP
jgi:RHS repeat-associated protein